MKFKTKEICLKLVWLVRKRKKSKNDKKLYFNDTILLSFPYTRVGNGLAHLVRNLRKTMIVVASPLRFRCVCGNDHDDQLPKLISWQEYTIYNTYTHTLGVSLLLILLRIIQRSSSKSIKTRSAYLGISSRSALIKKKLLDFFSIDFLLPS